MCLVGAIMLVALLNRTTLEINVLHDRNPPYVLLSDGGIRNGYTVKILNKLHQPREFTLEARGLPGARLAIVGMEAGAKIRVTTDDLRELKVFVTAARGGPARAESGSNPFALVVKRCRVAPGDGAHHAIPEAGRTPGGAHEPDRAAQRARRQQGLQGRQVLACSLAFFAAVFIVNGAMIYSALSTHTGLVANEPYRKGLHYNERIAADERQAHLGWSRHASM